MPKSVQAVPAEVLIRANKAAANGPRGFENATISIIKALSKEVSTDYLVAIGCRRWPRLREVTKFPALR